MEIFAVLYLTWPNAEASSMMGMIFTQPFADWLCSGTIKWIIRKQGTNYRGWVFIASARVRLGLKSCPEVDFGGEDFPRGKVVGKAKLVDIKSMSINELISKESYQNHLTPEICIRKYAGGRRSLFILEFGKAQKFSDPPPIHIPIGALFSLPSNLTKYAPKSLKNR